AAVLSNATPPTATYTLSLHDALPIFAGHGVDGLHLLRAELEEEPHRVRDHLVLPQAGTQGAVDLLIDPVDHARGMLEQGDLVRRSEEHTSELQSRENLVCRLLLEKKK